MNTLDEVITVFETGMLISDKPVNEAFREFNSDALHYLKEYRSDKAMWEADRKGYLDWIEQYKEACEKHQQAVIKLKLKEKEVNEILTDYVALKQWWAEQQENPPLTWQELKQMEGQPVWVEPSGADGYWIIPYMFSETGGAEYCFAQGDQYWKEDMRDRDDGISWQAYRKERK